MEKSIVSMNESIKSKSSIESGKKVDNLCKICQKCRCRTEKYNDRRNGTKLNSLLQLSLAMNIVKVKRTIGTKTADEIIRILTDERFCSTSFREKYGSLEKCERKTEETIEKNKIQKTKDLIEMSRN